MWLMVHSIDADLPADSLFHGAVQTDVTPLTGIVRGPTEGAKEASAASTFLEARVTGRLVAKGALSKGRPQAAETDTCRHTVAAVLVAVISSPAPDIEATGPRDNIRHRLMVVGRVRQVRLEADATTGGVVVVGWGRLPMPRGNPPPVEWDRGESGGLGSGGGWRG